MNSSIAASPAPRRRSVAVWVIGIVVGLLLLAVLGLMTGLLWFGLDLFNAQAHQAIRADPAIAQAVGDIRDISMDLQATGNAPGAEEFAYRVEGSVASGLLVGRFVSMGASSEELRSGTLTLDDGTVIRIGKRPGLIAPGE